MRKHFYISLLIFLLGATELIAQTHPSHEDTIRRKDWRVIDSLTYQTQTGLPIAASKIYFTDRKFAFSGFGEAAFIHYDGPKDRGSEDIELYMTSLYRFVSYLAYKPKPWLVLYGELFFEYFRDQGIESDTELFVEVFADFLLDPRFNVRVGTHQVQIGYVNNHDEPIQFFSVNRPDVERIIIPSQWIDLGIMTYGAIGEDWSWSLSAYQGLNARNYNGGTWIRRGRDDELRFNFNSMLLNSQISYSGFQNTLINVSGLYTDAGNNEELSPMIGMPERINAPTYLVSSFVRNEWENFTFMLLGTYGRMNNTDGIYRLTAAEQMDPLGGQVLGREVFGYYLEVGYDLMPFFRNRDMLKGKSTFYYRPQEVMLPLFFRYEHLNTHASVHPDLLDFERFQSDLRVLTVGANFNPRRNVVLKTNYQFRWNRQPLSTGESEGNRFEFGFGFIF
ncbi:porin [Litoribacter populi]|uniref:porin n=1 Tax=Litoribacter populi TaxID=2598460 RepID=UPI00117F80E1|nr:porin [Litoribacter populi]